MRVTPSPRHALAGSVRSLLSDMIRAVGLYFLFVHFGTILTLVISGLVGFLPYSDRPGPGWYGPNFSIEQLRFYAEWGLLLAPYLIVFALILFFFVRLLRWAHTPKWLVVGVGSLLSFFASVVLVATLGWYIALAGFVPLVSGILGLLYGCFALPRYLGPPPDGPARWFHWVGLAAGVTAAILLLLYPRFAARDNQGLSVTFHQVMAGGDTIDWNKEGFAMTSNEITILKSLNLSGTLRGGPQHSQSGPSPAARVVVIVVGDLNSEIRIPQPRHTSVVVVIRGSLWEMYPENSPTIGRYITLRPGPGVDEFVARIDGNNGALSKDSIFTWYPPRQKVE